MDDFFFLSHGKVRYEFILIRTDTTRGPKSVKGNKNHIFALVLIFFRLDYEEEPQRNTSVYRLARIRVVRPRAYAEDTLRATSRYKASVARVVKTRIKTCCCKHKPLHKTSATLSKMSCFIGLTKAVLRRLAWSLIHHWVKDMWTPKDKNTGHKTRSKRVPNADTVPSVCHDTK